MRTGHRENMRRAIDQVVRERLTAQVANIDAFNFANLDRVKTRRLPTNGVHTGGGDFDVFAIPNQPAKQTLRDWAATNISGANKENAFHGGRRACEREDNLNLTA
jgi:hypothetical protein